VQSTSALTMPDLGTHPCFRLLLSKHYGNAVMQSSNAVLACSERLFFCSEVSGRQLVAPAVKGRQDVCALKRKAFTSLGGRCGTNAWCGL
jgi:hypothetical protein